MEEEWGAPPHLYAMGYDPNDSLSSNHTLTNNWQEISGNGSFAAPARPPPPVSAFQDVSFENGHQDSMNYIRGAEGTGEMEVPLPPPPPSMYDPISYPSFDSPQNPSDFQSYNSTEGIAFQPTTTPSRPPIPPSNDFQSLPPYSSSLNSYPTLFNADNTFMEAPAYQHDAYTHSPHGEHNVVPLPPQYVSPSEYSKSVQNNSLPSLPPVPASSYESPVREEPQAAYVMRQQMNAPLPANPHANPIMNEEIPTPSKVSVINLSKGPIKRTESMTPWTPPLPLDDDQLVDDPRLVKVKDHMESISNIPCTTLHEPHIQFINFPPPVVPPMSFVLASNSGKNQSHPTDYSQIIKNCATTRQAFIDQSFPSAPIHQKCNDQNIIWRRIKDVEPSALFYGSTGAQSSDILQGGAADSPFLVVLSAVSSNPKLMKQISPSQDWNKSTYDPMGDAVLEGDEFYQNVFRFQFWKWGKWVEIVVDDQLPFIGVMPAFARCRNPKEFWVPLLEKAYAKFYGSYQAIEFCTVDDVILDLTGGSCENIDLQCEFPDTNLLWDYLQYCSRKKHSLFCAIQSSERQTEANILIKPNGLLIGRPYRITGLLSLTVPRKKSCAGEHQLVRISSLWGDVEWKGAWGPFSKEIQAFSAKELQKKGLTFGKQECWISLVDLLSEFNQIHIGKGQSYLERKKHYSQFSIWLKCWGSPAFSAWNKNPQYLLTVSQNAEVLHLSLLQQDWKIFVRDTNQTHYHIGLVIFKVEDNRDVQIHRISDIVAISEFVNKQESSTHVQVNKGRYIVIPCTYYNEPKKKNVPFLFRLWTEKGATSCKELKLAAPKVGFFQSKPSGVFTIEIVKAKGLTKAGIITCDPFAEISVEGKTKKTRVGEDPINPIWRQQFIFFIRKPNKAKVKIIIWHDGVLLTTFMGQATFQISNLLSQISGATYRCSLPLEPRKKDEKQGKTVTGFVVVRLSYFGDIKSC